MQVEEFESLNEKDLRQRANDLFAQAALSNEWVREGLLVEARFYLDEIEKRKNEKIGRRDFRMELIVIVLIFAEIIVTITLAIWAAREQAREMKEQLAAYGKMQEVLSHLQDSSKATADTLSTLNGTTKMMNGAIQKQVELFYDVEINAVYQEPSKKLLLINTGRTSVMLWSIKIGDSDTGIQKKPQVISPSGSGLELPLGDLHTQLSKTLGKDKTQVLPFLFLVTNEKGDRVAISGELTTVWHGDTMGFLVHTNSVTPGWYRMRT